MVFSKTTAPAAIILLLPTCALSITIAPIPISTLSSITQPCTIALCPMLTLFPMIVFVFSKVQCITAPSCTFTLLPILILFTSPRITALNHTLQSFPITTSPTIVALGATKQSLPITGLIPFTGSIKLIFIFFSCPGFCFSILILAKFIQRNEGISCTANHFAS